MTINRDGFQIEMQCDMRRCGETSKLYDKDDFYILIEDAKSEGWAMGRDDSGEWWHMCPGCRKKTDGKLKEEILNMMKDADHDS